MRESEKLEEAVKIITNKNMMPEKQAVDYLYDQARYWKVNIIVNCKFCGDIDINPYEHYSKRCINLLETE